MGNRRFIVVAALGVLLAGGLSGCSAGSSLTVSDAAAVAIGQEARAFSPPSSQEPTTGWSSSATCPDGFRQGLLASVPAGTTLTTLDDASTSGVPSDPSLTAGDVPTCVYELHVTGETLDAVVFLGMGESYQSAIVAKLVADGFSPGATTSMSTGSAQLYTKGTARIVVEKFLVDGTTFFSVIG